MVARINDGAAGGVPLGLPVERWATSEPRSPSSYRDGSAPVRHHGLTDVLVAEPAAGLPEQQRARVAPLACGVGELLLRHGDPSHLTQEEQARPDHPALAAVDDLARGWGVPVPVHSDVSTPGRPSEREHLPELRRAPARHPRTTVVWCHAGADRALDAEDLSGMVRSVLEDHSGLHVDLSRVVCELAAARLRSPAATPPGCGGASER